MTIAMLTSTDMMRSETLISLREEQVGVGKGRKGEEGVGKVGKGWYGEVRGMDREAYSSFCARML